MEVLKDLTPMLEKMEAKDRFYKIEATIVRLLAPQDAETVRQYIYQKTPWGKIERVEARTDGTPTEMTAPRRKKKTREGESEIKTGQCWSFLTQPNGEEAKPQVLVPWGGGFGIFKVAWRRTLLAKGDRYTNPKLDLIQIYPEKLLVDGPIDSLEVGKEPEANGNNMHPKVVLTNRNVRTGKVMVEEFFDYLLDRKITFYVEVDSGNPINEEKFVEMVKSINTLDSFGPSKRGRLRIDKIEQIKLSPEEVRDLS